MAVGGEVFAEDQDLVRGKLWWQWHLGGRGAGSVQIMQGSVTKGHLLGWTPIIGADEK
jgi:hypothetical protein